MRSARERLPAVGSELEPVRRVIGRGERVVAAPESGRDAIDLAFSVARTALEHHVLEEVRDSRLVLPLVTRADAVPEEHRDDGVEMALGE
jgi:hypothetical protein